MKLLEYEAKAILARGHVPVPDGIIITKHTDTSSVTLPIVLKSQVPVGGRGKLGGVIVVDEPNKLEASIAHLLSLDIKGFKPTVLIGEEKLAIKAEQYLSLLVDPSSATIQLVAHKDGGIEVENNNSTDFLRLQIDCDTLTTCADQLATYLRHSAELVTPLLTHLLDAFIKNDATLLEINPLILTDRGDLVCGDCKMELDDAAYFRHPDWKFEDVPSDTNFVTLDPNGSIATIANGAGLAMATVDAVAASGLKPANFLDIGGGANTESVLKAFRRIVEFSDVQAIVINIFAGITRCDEIAKAIIEARKHIDMLPPLFIRLAGTNFEEAVAMLSAEDITTLATLEECLVAAKKVQYA